MQSNKNTGGIRGKGYYIALILCAAAIGISGYVYYQNTNDADTQLQDPVSDTAVAATADDNAPVAATDQKDAVLSQPGEADEDVVADDGQSPDQAMVTCAPLTGQAIADYAMDCLAYNATTRDWRVHDGIDIAAEAGSAVRAAADGTVYTVYDDDSMGTTVVIRHADGYVTVYSSLAEDVPVSAGDTVTMGQTIGTVGNTALLETAVGDHLHFSVTHDGEAVDPADFCDLG